MLVLILYPFIYDIKKFHELIIMLSFLIMVRALFTTFTHLSNPADALNFPVPKFLFFLDFKNDLFFSGHTAVPFLGFLLFKDKIKYFFLASSFIMAFAVLSMHIHYTIDVMSAFFITYCVYKIGEAFFNRIDYNKSKYRRIFEI